MTTCQWLCVTMPNLWVDVVKGRRLEGRIHVVQMTSR